MKIFASIVMLFLICCKASVKTDYLSGDIEKGYTERYSPNHHFVLFYKFEDNFSNPARWLTYFVKDAKTHAIKIKKDKILADSIYWKSDDTLIILPYRTMIKSEVEVKDNNESQILIRIK